MHMSTLSNHLNAVVEAIAGYLGALASSGFDLPAILQTHVWNLADCLRHLVGASRPRLEGVSVPEVTIHVDPPNLPRVPEASATVADEGPPVEGVSTLLVTDGGDDDSARPQERTAGISPPPERHAAGISRGGSGHLTFVRHRTIGSASTVPMNANPASFSTAAGFTVPVIVLFLMYWGLYLCCRDRSSGPKRKATTATTSRPTRSRRAASARPSLYAPAGPVIGTTVIAANDVFDAVLPPSSSNGSLPHSDPMPPSNWPQHIGRLAYGLVTGIFDELDQYELQQIISILNQEMASRRVPTASSSASSSAAIGPSSESSSSSPSGSTSRVLPDDAATLDAPASADPEVSAFVDPNAQTSVDDVILHHGQPSATDGSVAVPMQSLEYVEGPAHNEDAGSDGFFLTHGDGLAATVRLSAFLVKPSGTLAAAQTRADAGHAIRVDSPITDWSSESWATPQMMPELTALTASAGASGSGDESDDACARRSADQLSTTYTVASMYSSGSGDHISQLHPDSIVQDVFEVIRYVQYAVHQPLPVNMEERHQLVLTLDKGVRWLGNHGIQGVILAGLRESVHAFAEECLNAPTPGLESDDQHAMQVSRLGTIAEVSDEEDAGP